MADIQVESRRASVDGSYPLESDFAHMHPLVSWRSMVAGLLISLLTLATLLSLGMAFGGIGLNQDTDAQSAGIFTGVWFLISAIISIFVGSYFAARISKFHTTRLGSAQGLVIASLFFGLFLWQTFSAIGWVGRTTGQAVSSTATAVGSGASQLANNPAVTSVVENALGDLKLRSDIQTVASGVASRLMQGNTQGARNYLASQAGISPAEADQRIAAFRDQANQAMIQAREGAAKALQATGWTLFTMMVLGSAAAIGGGALGARANLRKPLTREQIEAVTGLRTAHV